jgi:hypothetical protein
MQEQEEEKKTRIDWVSSAGLELESTNDMPFKKNNAAAATDCRWAHIANFPGDGQVGRQKRERERERERERACPTTS